MKLFALNLSAFGAVQTINHLNLLICYNLLILYNLEFIPLLSKKIYFEFFEYYVPKLTTTKIPWRGERHLGEALRTPALDCQIPSCLRKHNFVYNKQEQNSYIGMVLEINKRGPVLGYSDEFQASKISEYKRL